MPIEIRQLRYAVLTADARSFASAASRMRIKQATLSRRVQQLEDRLGVKLFERTTRGAQPTEAGRAFLEIARRIVTDVENLQNSARAFGNGQQGYIAVGYSSPLMAGKLKLAYSDYLIRYPHIQFDVVEADPESLFNSLRARTIDVAIAPTIPSEDGIVSRSLWSERLIVALNTTHHLQNSERIYWSDLRQETFVIPRGGIGPIIENLLSARLTEPGYRANVIVQEASIESLLSMISVGCFVTITTDASQGVNWPDVNFREIYDSSGPARLEYSLYWHADNENPALQRFFKLIDERYPG